MGWANRHHALSGPALASTQAAGKPFANVVDEAQQLNPLRDAHSRSAAPQHVDKHGANEHLPTALRAAVGLLMLAPM
jgi:hypothetical protein